MGMGGGGSAGGGSQGSGTVDYPAYMKTRHETWLNEVNSVMVAARAGGSPFFGILPYDPNANLDTMDGAADEFKTIVLAMSFCDKWGNFIDCAKAKIDGEIVDEATADANIVAFGDLIDDQITSDVLPRFEAGMVDINSVVSSAFVIGRAVIEDGRNKAVAKYGADLKLQNYRHRNEMIMTAAESMKGLYMQYVEFYRVYATLVVEIQRLKIVARTEYENQRIDFTDRDAKWDLETFQYGANVMGAISGASVSTSQYGPGQLKPNPLGGTLSGAAAGAMVGFVSGGPHGAVIGGAIGAGAGLISSF